MIKCDVKCDRNDTCCLLCDRRSVCEFSTCKIGDPAACGHATVDRDLPLRQLISLAILMWGKDSQMDMVTEEAGELIVAINHLRRGRGTLEDVMREVVDVELMCEEMKIIFSNDQRYNELKEEKMAKFRKQVEQSFWKRVRPSDFA